MKKSLALLLALLLLALTACGGEKTGEEEQFIVYHILNECDPADMGTSDWPVSIDPATVEDNEAGNTVLLDLYSMEYYDAVELSQLKPGDGIVIENEVFTVESIEDTAKGKRLNGGLENDGYDLVALDGGVFRVSGYDDAATYIDVAGIHMNMPKDIVLKDGSAAPDAEAVVYEGDAAVADFLRSGAVALGPGNAVAHFTDGELTEIELVYTP